MGECLTIHHCFRPLTEVPDPRWSRIVTTLANPGDWILAEEWTYASALICAQPWGIKMAPVAVDGEGLCAVDLRRVLTEWNDVERGGKRFISHLFLWNMEPWADHQIPGPTFSTPSPSARIPLVV